MENMTEKQQSILETLSGERMRAIELIQAAGIFKEAEKREIDPLAMAIALQELSYIVLLSMVVDGEASLFEQLAINIGEGARKWAIETHQEIVSANEQVKAD